MNYPLSFSLELTTRQDTLRPSDSTQLTQELPSEVERVVITRTLIYCTERVLFQVDETLLSPFKTAQPLWD